MRTLFRLFLLLATLLVLAWATVPWWVPALAREAGERSGVDVNQFVIERPGFTQLAIPELRLRWETSAIDIEHAAVHYRFGSLVAGRLERIDLATLNVTVTSAKTESESAQTAAGFLLLPDPALLWQQPVNAMRIDAVSIRLDDPVLELRGRLELTSNQASFGLANTTPGDFLGLAATGTVERHGAVSITATLPDRELPLALVDGQVAADGTATLEGRITLQTADFALLDPLLGTTTEQGSLKLLFDAHYAGALPTGSGSAAFHWAGDAGVAIEVSGDGRFDLADDALAMVFDQQLDATVIMSETPEARLILHAPVDLVVQVDDAGIRSTGGIQFELAETDLDGIRAGFQGGWLDIRALTFADSVLNVTANSSGIARVDDRQITTLAAMQITLEPKSATGTVTLSTPGVDAELPLKFDHDLLSGKGSGQFNTAVNLDAALVASLAPGWQAPVDVQAGTAELTGQARWTVADAVAFEVDAEVRISRLAGAIEDNLFRDASATLTLDYLSPADDAAEWRVVSDDVRLGLIDVGFPVTDVTAALELTADEARIEAFSGHTLGGQFRTAPFAYDIPGGNAQFEVEIEDLQLADVLALEGDDITGTGILDGRVPVVVRNDVITVTQGSLSAEPPGGVIRYAGAAEVAAAAGQPGLDFALRALTDFTYERLAATIEYAPDGTLGLGIALEGSNPAIEKGRAIHYNLNISENIPDLIRSLQLSDELSEGIQQKLNR